MPVPSVVPQSESMGRTPTVHPAKLHIKKATMLRRNTQHLKTKHALANGITIDMIVSSTPIIQTSIEQPILFCLKRKGMHVQSANNKKHTLIRTQALLTTILLTMILRYNKSGHWSV